MDTLNQLWKRMFSMGACIVLADNAPVAQEVTLIKHPAHANEELLPSLFQVTVV